MASKSKISAPNWLDHTNDINKAFKHDLATNNIYENSFDI